MNTYTISIPATHGSAYSVILEPSDDGDGIWTAEVPALGIVTEGRGRAGAERAASNAIRGYRTTAARNGKEVPTGDLQVMVVPSRGWQSRSSVAADMLGLFGRRTAKKSRRKKAAAGTRSVAKKATSRKKTSRKKASRRRK